MKVHCQNHTLTYRRNGEKGKAMNYRGFEIKWRVFDYDDDGEYENTVNIFADPETAARYCIDHRHAGVEMIAFPIRKAGART